MRNNVRADLLQGLPSFQISSFRTCGQSSGVIRRFPVELSIRCQCEGPFPACTLLANDARTSVQQVFQSLAALLQEGL